MRQRNRPHQLRRRRLKNLTIRTTERSLSAMPSHMPESPEVKVALARLGLGVSLVGRFEELREQSRPLRVREPLEGRPGRPISSRSSEDGTDVEDRIASSGEEHGSRFRRSSETSLTNPYHLEFHRSCPPPLYVPPLPQVEETGAGNCRAPVRRVISRSGRDCPPQLVQSLFFVEAGSRFVRCPSRRSTFSGAK